MRLLPSALFRWLLPVLWMTCIFTGSTDLLSANHTSRFVEPFLRWLFHGTLSNASINEIHFLIRKTGHLCEYAVLCVLFWWALSSPEKTHLANPTRFRWRRASFAVLLSACYAASDEFHQSFVPSRGASVEDVLIDTAGAAIGLAVFLGASRLLRSLHPNPFARGNLQAGTARPPSPPG